jgi:hypothetical protein
MNWGWDSGNKFFVRCRMNSSGCNKRASVFFLVKSQGTDPEYTSLSGSCEYHKDVVRLDSSWPVRSKEVTFEEAKGWAATNVVMES